jgi:hypothetical protein
MHPDTNRPAALRRARLRSDLLGYGVDRYAPDSQFVVAERFWFGNDL